ncbi:MAG: hypothetical protein GY953_02615, partial [bacterium]|nr:hypothetical protein [bacterium]
MRRIDVRLSAVALVAFAAATAATAQTTVGRVSPPQFEITIDPAASDKHYTGRLYLILTNRPTGEPRRGVGWQSAQPLFSLDVEDWKPGDPLRFDPEKAKGNPYPMTELPRGSYRAQAVIDLNGWSHSAINAAGNAYSEPVAFEHGAEESATVELRITKKISAPPLKESKQLKYVKLRSNLLSRFYGRVVYLQAAVRLPKAY